MAANSESEKQTFRLFSPSTSLGLGFLDSSENPLPPTPPPPPPYLEVISTQISSSVKYTVEPVNLGELTLLKGRVNTQEVFGLSNSDLVPGKYEGGLKLWEGSMDLVKALHMEVKNGNLSLRGKRVLELGCGHGLPGIFACLEGAAAVHFQDFNAEVLRCLTIPNVNANLSENIQPLETNEMNAGGEVRFFAGDWSEIHKLLPCVQSNEKNLNCSSGHSQVASYDIILMAETVYSISTLQSLYELIKMCTSSPHGVVYMAAKKHYFGVLWLLTWLLKLQMVRPMSERYGSFHLGRSGFSDLWTENYYLIFHRAMYGLKPKKTYGLTAHHIQGTNFN